MSVRRSGRPGSPALSRPLRPLVGGLVPGLILGLALTFGAAAPGGATPTAGAPATGTSAPGAATTVPAAVSTVLLLSGDRVTRTAYPDGTATVTVDAAERPDGAPVAFETVESADGHYVIPTDAAPLLADGVLDTELFNVTTLVEEGLASEDELPVIITTDPGGPATLRSGAISGSAPTATLSSIDAAAYELDGDATTALWDDLTDELTGERGDRARTASPGTRIWLDRAVEVALDQSVPQIGAPALWDAGYDGSGVTVAVLDTGADPDHPDLAGQVVDTANFTTDPSAVDGHGHGTHVASTVAGSGAASGGTYRGVAPGADLLIGKVLPDSGSGPTSAVIAGMEWAAQAGADIISLSLGGPASDGSDPASRALEELTAQTGALFVVASGNNEGDASVNSPGAASSALTVGAVDKVDTLASFSNRGPRRGDAAVKPELTAPGVGIVAARAGGTSMGTPVNDYYTSAGGTSMATPHVSGAAALLRQSHPDWTAGQLKDALVSTAEPGNYTTFQGGAGRIDVARAATSGVTGPATADIGMFPAPYDEQRTRTLTYRNHTDAPVTLDLALSGESWTGEDLPAGAVSLDASQVTLPAGGTAAVALTVDAGPGEVGAYTGVVTASAGELALRTPFGYYKSTGSHELTVRAVDFRGEPAGGAPIRAVKLDGAQPNDPFHSALTEVFTDDNGEARIPVAGGFYDVYGDLGNPSDLYSPRLTSLAETELEITGDTRVELDAANAILVNPHWPEPTDRKAAGVAYHRGFEGGEFGAGFITQYSPYGMYIQPTEVTTGWLEILENWQVASALVSSAEVRSGSVTVPVPVNPGYHNHHAAPVLAGEHDLEIVAAGTGTPDELAAAGISGKVALIRIPIPPDADPNPVVYALRRYQNATDDAAALGAAGILFYLDVPGAAAGPGDPRSEEILQLALPYDEGVRVQSLVDSAPPDPVRLVLEATRDPERIYRVKEQHEDPSLPDPRLRVDIDDLVAIPTRYHADEPDYQQRSFSSAFTPRERTVGGLTPSYWAPFEVTEYVLPGEDLRWHRQAEQLGSTGTAAAHPLQTREVFLPGDEPAPETWFQSPIRTGAADAPAGRRWFDLRCTFCRHGDRFLPGIYYLDSDPRHFERSFLLEGSTYRMFAEDAGGTEIPNSGSALSPWFALDPAAGTYRLELAGVQPGWPQVRTLAPRIYTSWVFSSRRPVAGGAPAGYTCPFSAEPGGCEFPPLLQLDYQLGLDLLNRAPAGTSHTFEVKIAPHSAADWTARVVVLRLKYSTDGGATWTTARVRPVGRDLGRFEVTVRHPALASGEGGVWLRAEAWDTEGNRVEQTIERAYNLR